MGHLHAEAPLESVVVVAGVVDAETVAPGTPTLDRDAS